MAGFGWPSMAGFEVATEAAKETGFHMPNFQLALLKNTKRKRSTSDLRLYFNSDLCLHQCLIENVGEN
jgi:hypothetical protein